MFIGLSSRGVALKDAAPHLPKKKHEAMKGCAALGVSWMSSFWQGGSGLG